jgi:hypothetical protein
MLKANFNSYNHYVTDSIYQWDLNRVLSVTGLNLTVAPEIHFSNANMDKAIVRQAALTDRVVSVAIPNSLLQDPLTINAHIGVYEGKVFKVIEKIEIPVIPKKRPGDYRIENTDEEIYSFEALKNDIANMVMSNHYNADKAKIEARIDNIIAHNNDTEGNTELVDIRTDVDGNVHNSAGLAVRKQISDIMTGVSTADTFLDNQLRTYNLSNPETFTPGYFLSTNDELLRIDDPAYGYTDFISVKPGEKIIAYHVWGAQFSVSAYDVLRNFIMQQSYTEDTPLDGVNESISSRYWHVFTVPENVYYLRFNTKMTYDINCMIVRGSSSDDIPIEYSPYNPEIKAVSFLKALLESIEKEINIVNTDDNTVLGRNALPIVDGIRDNVALGAYAMSKLIVDTDIDDQSGRYNVAVGKKAMKETTTGNHNTACGFQAMMNNTTGTANTALGEDALMVVGKGSYNVAVGCRALQSATEGDYNTAVGIGAGYWNDDLNPTGNRNTMIGAHSGQADGDGSDNVAIGYFAKATSGLNHTIAIGSGANAKKDGQAVIGTWNIKETILFGDIIVCGTDGVRRKLNFNNDGTTTWLAVVED